MAKNSAADSVNMFEDLMTGLQDILKRLEMPGGFDDSGSEKNLVAKNIVPSDTSTFNKFPAVKSILSGNEKNRAYNIGLEWARAFFDVQKLNKSSEDISKPTTVLSKAKETVGAGKPTPSEKPPENKSSMLGIAAGIVGVLAAAYAIWEMFGAEGGFIMKAVSKLPNFLKLLKGTAGKIGAKILKRIKFIPFIGALAGFVFAFQRFQDGDWFKGTLELISAIASLTVVGLPLSYIIDGALLLHDLAEERGDETGMMAAAVKGGKYAAKAIFSILKKTVTKVGTKLLKVLKFIPFIGGVAGLALSYMRFQEGEWVAGIFEFVSAILDFIPGVGNLASYIIDGGLLLYDLLKTPTAEGDNKPSQGSGLGFSFSNGMNYIKKLIGPALTKALPYIPVIGNFAAIYTGITSIMSGDIGFGVRKLIQGLFIFLPPGLSDQLINGFQWLMSIFTDGEQESDGLPVQAPKPFLSMVKDYIKSKLQKLPAILRKPLQWLGILDDSSGGSGGDSSSAGISGPNANEEAGFGKSLVDANIAMVTYAADKIQSITSSVASVTSGIANSVIGTITSTTDKVKSIASSVAATAFNVAKSAVSAVKSVATTVSNIAKSAVSTVKSVVSSVATTVSNIAKSAVSTVKSVVSSVVSSVAATASNIAKSTVSTVKSVASSVATTASNIAKSAANTVKATANKVAEVASNIVKTTVNKIKSVTKAAAAAATNIAKSVMDSPLVKYVTDKVKSATEVVGTAASSIIKSATAKVQSYLEPSKDGRSEADNIAVNTNKVLTDMQGVFNDIKASNFDIKVQTHAILAQNQILQEIVYIARQQLDVSKKKSGVIVNNMQGPPSNNTNISNESFNTATQSSRQLYSSSPYTLSYA